MSRRPMLALVLVGSVLAWTVHRAMQKAKRKATKAMPAERPTCYHTDEWDAEDIEAHRRHDPLAADYYPDRWLPGEDPPSRTSGLLCPDYAVTFGVATGSDIVQVPNEDYPKS